MAETEDGIGQVNATAGMAPGGERSRWMTLGLGAVMVLAVYLAGMPSLDAPWILGDDYIFIVRNPEVTGVSIEDDSTWQRLKLIFRFPPAEDLYQPLPILTYAAEWSLWDGSPTATRRLDVLLHALNALLLWCVLSGLLRAGRVAACVSQAVGVGSSPQPSTADETSAATGRPARRPAATEADTSGLLSWGLAIIWALHPVLTSTYAADMGRTHLMSATFALLSLRLHLAALQNKRAWLFVVALIALLAAMLCKVIVGWVLLILVLEFALVGWRKTLRSPRVYVVGVVCVAFAALTYWTSRRAGVAQDAAAGLFGDPFSRSALAVWIYLRDIVAPLWLSTWHLPDPHTGWTYGLVWVGLLAAITSAVHAALAWRRPERRLVTLGWVWFWAGLMPVIGVIGAREAAATDRYLYQPLMGIMLVIGASVLGWMAKRSAPRNLSRGVIPVTGLLAAGLLLWSLPYVKMFRSSLRRAERIVALNPGDPRALEALAVAYDFSADHAPPADDLARLPANQPPREYFLTRSVETLRQAAAIENLEQYFPGPDDRGPFHRRLSNMFKMLGQYSDSLAQAELARDLQPDVYLTWVRLAHAYQGLGRIDEALAAYDRCEQLLPDSPQVRATHFTDVGYLLLVELERADLAFPKFQAAVATGCARTLAYIGLARCEIRVGEGARGLDIIAQILHADPQNAFAALVLAEYHLRSNHWEEAATTYGALVATYPSVYARQSWYYEALRGFQSACGHLGRWHDAAMAWDQAVRLHPESREFRSFRVWALACADDENAPAWVDDLLANDPNNRMAFLSQALLSLRAGRVAEAVESVKKAGAAEPVARARELDRCVAVLTVLSERGELPPEEAIVRAAVHLEAGRPSAARELLAEYAAAHPDSPWTSLVTPPEAGISDEAAP